MEQQHNHGIIKLSLLFLLLSVFAASCTKDTPQNPEADILSFNFPADSLRNTDVNIYNTYVEVYPKRGIELQNAPFEITVTSGATYEKIEKVGENSDTLFFIKVTSEDRKHTKTHAIKQILSQSGNLYFCFENWTKYSTFENPKDGDIQWFSSNNGVSMVFGNKPIYPVMKTTDAYAGSYAVELQTMVGPGSILGGVKYIPCVAGSLYLGGFDMIQGLQNPLRSTQFGIPYNGEKPLKFSGYYKYKEGTADFINSDGSTDASKRDTCDIYAVLFKTDSQNPFLYGDNIRTSPNVIAKAQITHRTSTTGNGFVFFEVDFDYESYTMPFKQQELENGQYKIAIICTSSTRGGYYEGRPSSRLVVDELRIISVEDEVSGKK